MLYHYQPQSQGNKPGLTKLEQRGSFQSKCREPLPLVGAQEVPTRHNTGPCTTAGQQRARQPRIPGERL